MLFVTGVIQINVFFSQHIENRADLLKQFALLFTELKKKMVRVKCGAVPLIENPVSCRAGFYHLAGMFQQASCWLRFSFRSALQVTETRPALQFSERHLKQQGSIYSNFRGSPESDCMVWNWPSPSKKDKKKFFIYFLFFEGCLLLAWDMVFRMMPACWEAGCVKAVPIIAACIVPGSNNPANCWGMYTVIKKMHFFVICFWFLSFKSETFLGSNL